MNHSRIQSYLFFMYTTNIEGKRESFMDKAFSLIGVRVLKFYTKSTYYITWLTFINLLVV